MSVNNPAEAELRELVAKTLEEKGVLGKVKVTELSLIESREWCNIAVKNSPLCCIGTTKSERISSTSRPRCFNGERAPLILYVHVNKR